MVLIVDDTGFLKKGTRSTGAQRQYSGTADRIENCQIGVFLAYTSAAGHALIDRELYLPESWICDRDRCRGAGIGDTEFATKPVSAQYMIERALDADTPFSWLTADKAYGQVKYLRVRLEERDVSYVLATLRNDDAFTADGRSGRADEMIAAVPPKAVAPDLRRRRRPRTTEVFLGSGADPDRVLHLRRASPGLAGPRRTTLTELATVAGSRWRVEECFQQAEIEAGLDECQARTYRAWYAHATLSMLALAWLAGTKSAAEKGESETPTTT